MLHCPTCGRHYSADCEICPDDQTPLQADATVSAKARARATVYSGAEEISERHRHRYEFNPAFRETLEQGGLVFSGVSPDQKFIEIVELSLDEHPWFLACQFHPEFKSKPLAPPPLFASFVHAAFQNRLHRNFCRADWRAGNAFPGTGGDGD